MLTLEQVEKLLIDVYIENYKWSDGSEYLNWYEIEELFEWGNSDGYEAHGVTIENADFDTGGEGHGEDVHMIFKTTDRNGDVQYWRKNGYYASYSGTEWDGDFREVRPVERLVTFYE